MSTAINTSGIRNCYRCGHDFVGEPGKRVCPSCVVPETPRGDTYGKQLSFRERQVVNLVCQARLNKEIAFSLHLTEGTVKEYMNRIFHKVGVSNRTELAMWAVTGNRAAEHWAAPQAPRQPAVPTGRSDAEMDAQALAWLEAEHANTL